MMLCLIALKKTKLRAVVQADQIAKTERTVNDQLFFVENIPYSWMFQQVKAVVHHGGNTTNGLGLWAGLPTLVIPLARTIFAPICDIPKGKDHCFAGIM